jgi:hypothetical protein
MALRVDTQSTMQAAKKLLSIRVSNFMAVLRWKINEAFTG